VERESVREKRDPLCWERDLEVLQVSDDAGPFGRIDFDAVTHLPVRVSVRFMMTIGQMTEARRVTNVGDYRRVSGVMLPLSLTRPSSGRRLLIAEYDLNQPLPHDLFVEPGSDAALERIMSGRIK